jgi:WD repeat-containing protein 26
MREYAGSFATPAIRKYVHEISGEMGIHLETITRALHDFVEVGVPAIRFSQKASGQNLLNLSTIATFFSGVTATTAQYSFDKNYNILEWMTNLFFFGSLVLSISAAINSLLGFTWKHAM